MHRWKIRDWPGVIVAIFGTVPFERQSQSVAHEFDIAVNSLCADFQFVAKKGRVWISLALHLLMNAEHPVQRRACLADLNRHLTGALHLSVHRRLEAYAQIIKRHGVAALQNLAVVPRADMARERLGLRPLHANITATSTATLRWSCAFSAPPPTFP